MKRTTILALVYAILISMAAVSFSLYNSTVPLKKSGCISSKVFDISQTMTVDDKQYLETTPSWLFMVFKPANINGNNYDLNVQITLNSYPAAAAPLTVELYDQSNSLSLETKTFPIDSNIVTFIVDKSLLFQPDANNQFFTLKYTYGSGPVGFDNLPFSPDTVTSSVTVSGKKIEKIR